jgi:HEPN domain-containing protein
MERDMIQPGTVLIRIENDSIANWLRWADDDYIAARQLLLDNLLVQGAALANTAIEKYFKTIFLAKRLRLPKVHDLPLLYRRLNKSGITFPLSNDFLALLFKLYKLRYPEVVSVNWWKSSWHQPSTSEQLTESLLTPPPFVN